MNKLNFIQYFLAQVKLFYLTDLIIFFEAVTIKSPISGDLNVIFRDILVEKGSVSGLLAAAA